MGITIRSNVASLIAQRNLWSTQRDQNLSLERLSSGFRINRAADDAAGLAISENLKAQIRGLNQAKRNANDGISLIQTAEGALNEVSSILIRMRELSVQSANDTLVTRDRSFLNAEYSALKNEIDRISEVTEFNGLKLINGDMSTSAVDFQIGLDSSTTDRLSVTIGNIGTEMIGSGSTQINATYINTKASSRSSLAILDNAIDDVAEVRARMGAYQNRLNSTVVNLANTSENLTAANSRIRDADVANESAIMTRNQILMQAGVSVLAQANSSPQIALQLLQG